MLRIILLTFIGALAVTAQHDTWNKMEISENIFTIFHYGDLDVKIYQQIRRSEDKEWKPWYFHAPVNWLLPDSAECVFNKATKRNELRFSVEFWNDDLRKGIADHLNESEGIEQAKVAVIPFEQVLLNATHSADFYRPISDWVPFNGQKLMIFRLIVDSECEELANHMRAHPHDFFHLRLQFGSRDVKASNHQATFITGLNIPVYKPDALRHEQAPLKEILEHVTSMEKLLVEGQVKHEEALNKIGRHFEEAVEQLNTRLENVEMKLMKLEKIFGAQSQQEDSLKEILKKLTLLEQKAESLDERMTKNTRRLKLLNSEFNRASTSLHSIAVKANFIEAQNEFLINRLPPTTECPKDIGQNSNCTELNGMGCYCVVEIAKSLQNATEQCEVNGMKLVAIETQDEQQLVTELLTSHLGDRENYNRGFSTSGFDQDNQGRWVWKSSHHPLHFRNWINYWQDEKKNRILIYGEKPFHWFNAALTNDAGVFYHDYFICEASAPQQQFKHLVASFQSKNCPQTIGTNSSCAFLEPLGCYCVVLTEETWVGASRHCKSRGMQLLSIESESEHMQIASFLRQHKPSFGYWTSAVYKGNDQWIWSSNGQPVTYARWHEGEPQFKDGEGPVLMLHPSSYSFCVGRTSFDNSLRVAHYVCEDADASARPESPDLDWVCHNETTGFYCYYTVREDWASASALCQIHGMKLVSIESAAERFIVASILPKSDETYWWTSGSEEGDGQWKWATGEPVMTYTNWAPGEPRKVDSTEHAVAMFDGKWSIWPVSREYFPICEK